MYIHPPYAQPGVPPFFHRFEVHPDLVSDIGDDTSKAILRLIPIIKDQTGKDYSYGYVAWVAHHLGAVIATTDHPGHVPGLAWLEQIESAMIARWPALATTPRWSPRTHAAPWWYLPADGAAVPALAGRAACFTAVSPQGS